MTESSTTEAPAATNTPQHTQESSYKQTQNEIYKFQETLLNSIKEKNGDSRSNTIDNSVSVREAEDSGSQQHNEKTSTNSPTQSSDNNNNNNNINNNNNNKNNNSNENKDTLQEKPSTATPTFLYASSETAQSTINGTTLSSLKVFEYVQEHYSENVGKVVGVMRYHPYKEGILIDSSEHVFTSSGEEVETFHGENRVFREKDVGTKYNDCVLTGEVSPFIPNLDTLLKNTGTNNNTHHFFYVPYDAYFTEYLTYPRFINNEIWGYDIYTDDSDVLLILKQQELKSSENDNGKQVFHGFNTLKYRATKGPFFDKTRSTKQTTSFDILAQFVILPTLENYYGDLAQNGIFSRPWYGTQFNSSHDGYSIALYDAQPVYL
ncbi:hypothetical protein ACO0QE_001878 [Hanseniaspora vineae]